MSNKSNMLSELEIRVAEFIADNDTTSEEDSIIEEYLLSIGFTLDEILLPRESWDMKGLEIPDSRFMT